MQCFDCSLEIDLEIFLLKRHYTLHNIKCSLVIQIQGVQEKLCFFTIHCNHSFAYIGVRDLQSSQHNASVKSLLLAGIFCTTNSKLSRILEKNTIFKEHPVATFLCLKTQPLYLEAGVVLLVDVAPETRLHITTVNKHLTVNYTSKYYILQQLTTTIYTYGQQIIISIAHQAKSFIVYSTQP